MSEEKPDEQLLAKELAEMNEMAEATKWQYVPFIHFPKGVHRMGAIWDLAYYDTAEYVVNGICEGHLNANVHGAAGIYLFRHYVELALKYVLLYSLWLENPTTNAKEIQEIKKTHNLQALWDSIQQEVPTKLGQNAWDGFDTAFIDKVVRDLHAADAGSYTFRYMGGTFGQEEGEELAIDFRVLRGQMKHVYNVLHSMGVYLIETHGMNAEWEPR
jgi:hypothetical protein